MDLIRKFKEKNNIWFTSDTHFDHDKPFIWSVRGFESVDEMNSQLINKWNNAVGTDDVVFHLGDFCFGNLDRWTHFRDQLNGNIVLIKGNHDKMQDHSIKHLFEGIYNILEIDVSDESSHQGWQHIVLCHYAMRVWNRSHRGSYHLYGHSHGSLLDDQASLSFDAGVDCHGCAPVSYDQVKSIMSTKTFVPIDHHKP